LLEAYKTASKRCSSKAEERVLFLYLWKGINPLG
jgi:hypothetical protein